MTSVEIKKVINEHRTRSSDVMNLKYDSPNAPLIRYKDYINNNETIKTILSDIIEKAKNAEEMFVICSYGNHTLHYEVDEIENLAIMYKHLNKIAVDNFNLCHYASQLFAMKYKKYNDMINELLKTSVLPIMQFIQRELENLYDEVKSKEGQGMGVSQVQVHGDYYSGNEVVQVGNNNKMKDIKNDKSVKKFNFNKESFFIGLASAVVTELIVWGIVELIKFLIK